MHSHEVAQRYWFRLGLRCLTDGVIYTLSFLASIDWYFGKAWHEYIVDSWPGILLGAALLPSSMYVAGLYSPYLKRNSFVIHLIKASLCFLFTIVALSALFYVNYSARIGRGIMLAGSCVSFIAIMVRHALFRRYWGHTEERLALVIHSPKDIQDVRLFCALEQPAIRIIGIVCGQSGDVDFKGIPVLGNILELPKICAQHRVTRVLCSEQSLSDPTFYRHFWELRYSGITVLSLVNQIEELYHLVPVHLITPQWLLSASGSPRMYYIKKLKRAFDVMASIVFLILLSPAMFLGMLLIKATSRGPVLYSQIRTGRMGQAFTIYKLRTMRVDAEKDGPEWAAQNDSRLIFVGGFLRKYRIDEIPQLFNVLKGDMSFVGPRPERPEFILELRKKIPFFQERLLIQPGVTGWAQVNYPYGASVADSYRKLEYDLYYIKHMSLFFDLFILLDTFRTIVLGGAIESKNLLPVQNPAFVEGGQSDRGSASHAA